MDIGQCDFYAHRRGGGLRQINTCRQVPVPVNVREKPVKVGKNLHTRWLDNWRIFVPNIWWISPLTYYTDLLPHRRHN